MGKKLLAGCFGGGIPDFDREIEPSCFLDCSLISQPVLRRLKLCQRRYVASVTLLQQATYEDLDVVVPLPWGVLAFQHLSLSCWFVEL